MQSGAWLSPVERCVRVAEVPGSNPGAPIREAANAVCRVFARICGDEVGAHPGAPISLAANAAEGPESWIRPDVTARRGAPGIVVFRGPPTPLERWQNG